MSVRAHEFCDWGCAYHVRFRADVPWCGDAPNRVKVRRVRNARWKSAMAGTIGRRTFVKASLAAGISVIVRPLAATAQSAVPAQDPAAGYAWQRTPTTAARRIDGWQKVTGPKIYA